jgi:hypothetical protein
MTTIQHVHCQQQNFGICCEISALLIGSLSVRNHYFNVNVRHNSGIEKRETKGRNLNIYCVVAAHPYPIG